jgi:cysteine synthase
LLSGASPARKATISLISGEYRGQAEADEQDSADIALDPKGSELRPDRAFDTTNRLLIALVERPLLEPLGAEQASLGQHLQVFADRRLADAELLGNQHAANAILDQVSIDLRPEMAGGILQPFQNLQATFVGQGFECQVYTLLVAVGGGGLIGGIAAWYAGKVRVVGVEPELSPTLSKALAAGRPVDAEAGGIAADSLAPRRVGEHVFPLATRHVERVVLVSDQQIRDAQEALWRILRIVAEPGGAAAFAALLYGRYKPQPEERVGVLVSGGNTTAVDFTH